MHIIEEAFGLKCSLYSDVLNCPNDADKATLRKAYYRTALRYHPDKNPYQPTEAAKMFHAITAAYQILCNAELRAEYDETGIIPQNDDDDDFNTDGKDNPWKDYFDRIFGKVSLGDIEAFSMQYKCSDEEKRDVIKEFVAQKGNLVKMMDYVMLSEPRDAQRWVEDYIQPAIDSGEVQSLYADIMNRTLHQLQKKAEKEYLEEEIEDEDIDNDREVIDEDNDDDVTEHENLRNQKSTSSKKSKSQSPKKGKASKAKVKTSSKVTATKKKKNDMTDLIAQIQNKNRNGSVSSSNTWANFGARYGVTINDGTEPLLDDQAFAKARSKLKRGTKKSDK